MKVQSITSKRPQCSSSILEMNINLIKEASDAVGEWKITATFKGSSGLLDKQRADPLTPNWESLG